MGVACDERTTDAVGNSCSAPKMRAFDGAVFIESCAINVSNVSHGRLLRGDSLWLDPANCCLSRRRVGCQQCQRKRPVTSGRSRSARARRIGSRSAVVSVGRQSTPMHMTRLCTGASRLPAPRPAAMRHSARRDLRIVTAFAGVNAGQEPRLCDGEEADLVRSLHAAAARGNPGRAADR